MSQQRLAELAGIERKQLSILEGGGNVTLATIKKIVPHLPNMETFTLGGAPGKGQDAQRGSQVEIVEAAGAALATALQSLHTIVEALQEPRVPGDDGAKALHDANRALYLSMGTTSAEYDRMLAETEANLPPQEPMSEEAAAAALATLRELAAAIELSGEDDEDDEEES